MVAAKTERLLNLVICLLYTRRALTKDRIRRAVPQYEQTSDEAFDRMFERDKDELRELGIPLVTEQLNTLFEDEPGYRIDQREYALPPVTFAADELAVLGLAGRVWAQASLAGPAAQALRKLAAAGVERDDESLIGIEARVHTAEPAFDAVRRAVVERYPVRFRYRRPGDRPAERHLHPWGITSWHGRWYLTGFDTDRQAPRVFRLSRIEGTVIRNGPPGSVQVPDDHEPRQMIRSLEGVTGPPVPVAVRVRDGAGHALRRRVGPGQPAGPPSPVGWTRLAWAASNLNGLADELAGYGPDVVVEEPAQLRQSVRDRLAGALATHQHGTDGPAGDDQRAGGPGPAPVAPRTGGSG